MHSKEELGMTVSYKKLWRILLDKNMKKKELDEKAGITQYTMKKLNKDESVGTDTIGRICGVLGCTADDIMEFKHS
jgi:DNA-binding Xre family transcriptional regulator